MLCFKVAVCYDGIGEIFVVDDESVGELVEEGVEDAVFLRLLQRAVERGAEKAVKELRAALFDNCLEGFTQNFGDLLTNSFVDLTLHKPGQFIGFATK